MAQNIEQFGKYILLEKLASGGMAEVYLAKSMGAGGVSKFLAIKRILPQFSDNPEFIDMFKEEAKIAVNLNHGNVVSIYDFGVQKGQFFIVMEYVEGKNLRQINNELKKSNLQLAIDNIVYVIKEVAAGLDHAHRCIDGSTGKPLNITHRDMSPQNIMVSYEGEVKVIDFGIAKAETQAEATRAGTLKGKFGYMSPEQADGQIIDARTDIFSLGIVLWEMLANDRLFSGSNEAAILRKIKDCQIPSIRKLNPNVPPDLERIVNKALAKDKSLRYQTAAAMHRDLNRFLNTQYPEFSAQDFSGFVKNAFAVQVNEMKGRLIEYSKLQTVVDEKTMITKGTGQTGNSNQSQQPTPQAPQMKIQGSETQSMANAISGSQEEIAVGDNSFNIDPDSKIHVNLTDLRKEGKLGSGKSGTGLSQAAFGTKSKLKKQTGSHSGVLKSKVTRQTGLHRAQQSASRWFGRISVVALFAAIVTAVAVRFNKQSDALLMNAGLPPVFGKLAHELVKQSLGTDSISSANIASQSPQQDNGQRNPTNLNSSNTNLPTQAPPPVPKVNLETRQKFNISISSDPPGARIYLNGEDSGFFTPTLMSVEGNTPLHFTLTKEGYNTFEFNRTVSAQNDSVVAQMIAIQKPAYINLRLVNAGSNPVIEVNGQRIFAKPPIENYPIPARTPIRIYAKNPFLQAEAEIFVTVEANTKKSIELVLQQRTPANSRGSKHNGK